jgi:hypothetical protein
MGGQQQYGFPALPFGAHSGYYQPVFVQGGPIHPGISQIGQISVQPTDTAGTAVVGRDGQQSATATGNVVSSGQSTQLSVRSSTGIFTADAI